MSDNRDTFMALALSGEVLSSEIDDYVDEWHDSDSDLEIYSYLGMTPDEYSLWLTNPDYIDLIVAARHRRQPLVEAVNDNVSSVDRLAARSGDPRSIKRLKLWIAEQDRRKL
jgi:hypothetical protein